MTEYLYRDDQPTWPHAYLWPVVTRILESQAAAPRRLFELGCGNGATARLLAARGYDVTAVDPSTSGVAIASRHAAAGLKYAVASADDDLAGRFGTFDVVISLEVIEHCPSAAQFGAALRSLVRPGGVAIVSTPYHGYLKNAAIVLSGGFDRHFNPLWEGGHVKFYSRRTLRGLLTASGFSTVQLFSAGRIPLFAKSMVALATVLSAGSASQ